MPQGVELLAAAARWVALVATLVVVGACVFRAGILRALARVPDTEMPLAPYYAANVGALAALALMLAAALRLYTQVAGFADPGETMTMALVRTVLGETAWGRGWITQFLAAGLAFAGFTAARVMPGSGWLLAVAGGSAVVLAAPLTGHAAAAERAGSWGYPLDALHVLGASTWLGTLLVLVTAGFAATMDLDPGPRERRIEAMISAFSPVALTGAATAIGAGLILAFRYLGGSIPALWSSRYGRTLLIKVALLALVMALGAYNWRVQSRRLGDAPGSARIRRSSLIELVLGTILLAVTALLVSMPMPGEE